MTILGPILFTSCDISSFKKSFRSPFFSKNSLSFGAQNNSVSWHWFWKKSNLQGQSWSLLDSRLLLHCSQFSFDCDVCKDFLQLKSNVFFTLRLIHLHRKRTRECLCDTEIASPRTQKGDVNGSVKYALMVRASCYATIVLRGDSSKQKESRWKNGSRKYF